MQAYRIADNKTGEIAEWNYDLLPVEIKELQEKDFDLSLLGFDTDGLIETHNFRQVDALPLARAGTLEEKLTELFG